MAIPGAPPATEFIWSAFTMKNVLKVISGVLCLLLIACWATEQLLEEGFFDLVPA